uniref:Glycoside-hydrolase family GH114 TIM-barrel domain-containing protein n=1 Tax=Magallana gigas TaxID=29159 RepID=K1PGU5_MAGGI
MANPIRMTGTYEDWRPDIGQFPPDALGNGVTTWRGERWVDIRDTRIRDVMRKRIQMAQQQGCHGVDPGNVDGYTQSDLGFNLTYDNQIDYNRFLAREAHNHGLAIGLKNDLLQIKDLLHDFDFAINESCEQFRYNVQKNCLLYQPFFDARKSGRFHPRIAHAFPVSTAQTRTAFLGKIDDFFYERSKRKLKVIFDILAVRPRFEVLTAIPEYYPVHPSVKGLPNGVN